MIVPTNKKRNQIGALHQVIHSYVTITVLFAQNLVEYGHHILSRLYIVRSQYAHRKTKVMWKQRR